MAINSQKFLPASKIKSSTSIIKVQKIIPSLRKGTEDISSIAKKVNIIANLVSSTAFLKKKTEEETKKETQNKKREKKETRLEKKENKLFPTLSPVDVPKTGFLDVINRFITFTLLGLAFKKLYPHLPQIIGFIKNINPIIKLFEVIAGSLFKGIVDFIDFGYKAHDIVRDFTKKLGGEGFQKTFDDFSKNLNTFVNLAIVAGMLSTGGPDFGLGKKGGKGGRPGRGGRQPLYNNRGFKGKQGWNLSWERATNPSRGLSHLNADRDIMKRYFQRYGRDKFIQRFGQEGLEALPKGAQRGALQRGARSAFMGLAGKSGAKAVLKFTRPLLKRLPIPIIGALIDFGLSIAMGEPLGRAAFKAIGAGLLGTIGTGFGGPLGAILGGFAGDWAGGKLYDVLFGGQKNVDNTKQQIKTKKTGGKVTTRKGKVIGGAVKRTIRGVYTPTKPKQVKPGLSVGGDKKIKQFFPEPPKNQIGKAMDPYGFLTKTTKDMGSIPFFGSIFNIFGKVLLGDLPTKDDFKIIGSNMNAWINGAISKGILQGNLTSAFADGGLIDIEGEMRRNISGWVEKSVEELVKNKVTDAINELRKNLGMEPIGDKTSPSITGDPLAEGATATGIGLMDGLIQRGFTKEESAAIVGNLWAESSFRTNALNSNSGAFGLMQWTQGRKAKLYNYAAEKGKSVTDVDFQLDYIKWELKGGNSYETSQFQKAMSYGSDVESKTRGFAEQVERASARELSSSMNKRIGAAQSVYIGKKVPGERPPLGRISGNLKAAQDLAANMGLTMSSGMYWSDGRRRTGLHGAGRALDFSNGINTPQQMTFAKEMIQKYGKSLEQLIYTPLGYGISKGQVVNLDHWGDKVNAEHYNHVHVAFKKGGEIGEQKVKPLQKQAYYEEGSDSMIYILPIHIKEQIPIPVGNSRSSFPGSLNRSMYSRVSMQ